MNYKLKTKAKKMEPKLHCQKKIVIVSIIAILISSISYAQWSAHVNLSPNAQSASTNESMGSCIGVSGDTIHVIWADKHTATHSALYYTRSVDTGLTWSVPVHITDTSGNAWNPAIAVNGKNVHVVWRYIDPVTGKRSSWYKHSTNGGNTWGPNVLLDTAIADWPAVAVSGDKVYVANDYVTSANPYNTEIFFLRSTNNGVTWGTHQQLTFAVNRSEDEAITAQGSHVHMSWNDKRTGQFQIFYKESNDYGVTWGPDVVVTPASDYGTMVSIDGAHVDVVSAGAPSGLYQILLAQSADTGATWAPSLNLTNDTAHTYFYPHMARNGSDLHVVCGGSNGARYIHSADGGSTWDAPYVFTGSNTFVAYTGCAVHIIYNSAAHKVFYLRNPTANAGHCANATVSVNEINTHQTIINISPNPSEGIFNIDMNGNRNKESEIKIFNILGEQIYQSTIIGNHSSINLRENENGIYFVRITDKENNVLYSQRIIKQ